MADFLTHAKILKPEDTLLDIGAGMGSYDMELAKHCQSVTALDMNGNCLAVLENWADQCAQENIRTVNLPWEQYSWEEKFDVTFSAMCPAICNREELLRMEGMTRRAACLLTVTRGSYEKPRRELMTALPLKNRGGMVTEALHYYNVLYLMGRQPNVKTWSSHLETCEAVEDLLERYRIYLPIFGLEESEFMPHLEKFIEEHEDNGVIRDENQMNYALIWWNVPQKES